MSVIAVLGYVAVAAVGWLAGMLTFRRASHWCPVHGETLACRLCASGSSSRNARA
jgi:hypothetical protein